MAKHGLTSHRHYAKFIKVNRYIHKHFLHELNYHYVLLALVQSEEDDEHHDNADRMDTTKLRVSS